MNNKFIEAAKTTAENPQMAVSSILVFLSAIVMLISVVALLLSAQRLLKISKNKEKPAVNASKAKPLNLAIVIIISIIASLGSGIFFLSNFSNIF
ncbi:hypothetical protein [Vibrio casei]|uniref:Uncharacterized protein n=1 Tax=Vibrio casei TaxID=673372 RepID=A0A368LFU6_9VIBR|nr:hypothetical protein [Vibrio casei]RCS68326.1 hypothetical protein CIK83_18175 [Vibrio casei]RCS68641.1 hypothetical protein CIK83_17135 [Vibrio casei]